MEGTNFLIIKKRLQSYKVDLENANDRADQSEKELKEHKARAERAENEISALTRRIHLLEQDIARSEERLAVSKQKLAEATQVADESERTRKMLEHTAATDEERIDTLESSLKETKLLAYDSDRKYDEVARKLALVEADLARTQDRAVKAEAKEAHLEEELKVVGNSLRTLEMNEENALEQQQTYDIAIRTAQQRLLEAESRAEFAERTVQRLQKDVDRLEEALVSEREKNKHISEELDQTFSELTAC